MSVLIDTSVWVEHFRRPLPALIQLLRVDDVLTHPLVILELTCGTPPNRGPERWEISRYCAKRGSRRQPK